MELDECVFCGNEDQDYFREVVIGDNRAVECAVCGAHGPMKRSSLQAQLAWNDRIADKHAPRKS